MQDYREYAHELEKAIRAGTLGAGQKLLPQREFAWRRGIAVSTASRTYAELRRRGLVVGEVGRGTYVRPPAPAAAMPAFEGPLVDLDRNDPVLPGQDRLIAEALGSLSSAVAFGRVDPVGMARAREVAAAFVARGDWHPSPDGVCFTGNGPEALASALALLTRPGDRVGVEPLTCRVMKGACALAGVELVPLATDGEGVIPSAITDAHARVGLSCVYIQPTLHNPLGMTMGTARRREVAGVLESTGLFAIEEALNAFLADETPLAALAPDRVVVVDSFADRIAPTLAVGLLVVPSALRNLAPAAVRRTAWGVPGLGLAAAIQLIEDGTLARLDEAKRADAAGRQFIAREVLSDLEVAADGRAYHLWLRLPEGWRAETFAAAAARVGVAVTPGVDFAVAPGHSPAAVRLMLGTPTVPDLRDALGRLRRLALARPAVGVTPVPAGRLHEAV